MNTKVIGMPITETGKRVVKQTSDPNILEVAIEYAQYGFAVVPVRGKAPLIQGWQNAQPPSEIQIREWYKNGMLQNVGIIAGKNSGGIVVLDFDGQAAFRLFCEQEAFAYLLDTCIVRTGSGDGFHLYLRVNEIPPNTHAKDIQIPQFETDDSCRKINIELRGTGEHVVVPPSIHPDSGQAYRFENDKPILQVDNLNDVVVWLKALPTKAKLTVKAKGVNATGYAVTTEQQRDRKSLVKPRILQEIQKKLLEQGYTVKDEWLNGQCLRPQNHEHGDANPSFGYNVISGFGNCFTCGTIAPSEICEALCINHQELGGLYEVKNNTGNLTHDEVGDILLEQWNGNVAYFRGLFQTYQAGVWRKETNIERHVWDTMRSCKSQGIRPTEGTARSITAYLKSQVQVGDEQIDNGDGYISLANGLFNLNTFELEDYQRNLYLTTQLPFAYDETATCPTWLRFIDEMLVTSDGKPDKELHNVLQEAMGYSLTADTSYQVSFWLVGRPASGKSRVIEVLQGLMGTAHMTLDLGMLRKERYQLAGIPGTRIVTCTEAPTNTFLADDKYKALVGGDMMSARPIYGKDFSFRPQCKVWWAMNDMPRNLDRSGAVDRRIMIIPFNNPLPLEKRDIQLQAKLNAEIAGIFNWALEGLKRLNAQRQFTVSSQIEAAREEYKQDNDTEAQFLADWTTLSDDAQIKASQLYKAYSVWCQANGHHAKSSHKVAKEWERLGLSKKRITEGIFYSGIVLNNEGNDALRFV